MWIKRHAQAEAQETKAANPEWQRERCLWFDLLLVFVCLVSLLDASLVVYCRTSPEIEQNPFGSLLIRAGGQWGLFLAKMVGTSLAACLLIELNKKWREAAQLAVVVLAALQLILLVYLFS